MRSKITRTVGGAWEINATGDCLAPGHRVAGGVGEDYDTGRIDCISGEMATVSWDSGVTTPLPLSLPSVVVLF